MQRPRAGEGRVSKDKGDGDSGVITCSQSTGILEIKPVAHVIGGMVREAAAIRERLVG